MASLTQVAKIARSEALLITLGLISIILFILSVQAFSGRGKPRQTPPGVPWQNNIYAGTTTRSELESTLGKPKEIKEVDNNQVYLYPSNDEFRNHQILFSDDKITLIKEQVLGDEKGKLQDYVSKYGQPQALVYGRHGSIAPGHFWGNIGILVFANEAQGGIAEIWYFPPSTLADFLSQNPELETEEPTDF